MSIITNHWTPQHQNARYPRAYIGPNSNNNAVSSDFWYERGDYLRLKSGVRLVLLSQKVILKNFEYYQPQSVFLGLQT